MTDPEIVVVGRRLHRLHDPKTFFDGVRKVSGALNLEQIETVNAMLEAAAHWPIAWLAYGLATAWHEARFEPQPEWGRGKGHPYGVPHKYRQAPYGRGLVQLTHDFNYEWADEAAADAGIIQRGELLADFDKALEPELATFILVRGMETGAFTGKSLSDYLAGGAVKEAAYAPCRRIINGTDRAVLIAGHAMAFQRALIAGDWS